MNNVLNSSFRFYMLIAKIVNRFCLDHSRDDEGSPKYPVNFKLEFDTYGAHVFTILSKEFITSNITFCKNYLNF